ncbi:MAG: glycosyltransferase family 4 protein [Thermoplasmata archaeon]|nr:glycosyltransferase family 4 protein [Thermoplasmata archaeon]
MKVCLATVYSPREITGVGEVVITIGKGLLEKGHDFTVLTKSTEDGGPTIPQLAEIGYRDVRFFGGMLLVIGALIWLFRERKNIDLLHLHSVSWLTASTAVMGAVLGIPRVVTLHGTFPSLSNRFLNAVFNLSLWLVISYSNLVTCVSEETKGHHKLDSAIVIHNGIDTSRFSQDMEGRKAKREELELGDGFALLYIGRLDINKGIREIIQVAGDLVQEHADLRLLIVGPGDKEMVEECLREHSFEKNAIMVGGVENPVPYYQSSDAYVLFSAFEGIPLTLLEAMACGLPCIATSVGGIPEVIVDKTNGYLVQPSDMEGLRKTLALVLGNRDEAQEISSKARFTVENRFSSSRMIEDYLGVYESLVSG